MATQTYNCDACTYENPTSNSHCEICQTPNPKKNKMAIEVPSSAPTTQTYTCSVCTFINKLTNKRCDMCHTTLIKPTSKNTSTVPSTKAPSDSFRTHVYLLLKDSELSPDPIRSVILQYLPWTCGAVKFDYDMHPNLENGGPGIAFYNNCKTVRSKPEEITKTGWRQVRLEWYLTSPQLLKHDSSSPSATSTSESTEGYEDGLYEISFYFDRFEHNEIVIGILNPETAPTKCLCLHSYKDGKDGVWVRFFSFSDFKQGDTATMFIDLRNGILSFSKNGKYEPKYDIRMKEIPKMLVPVIELYGHTSPMVSITERVR